MSVTAASHVFCNTSFATRRRNCVKENWSRTKWRSKCKVTGNKRFYIALLLNKFKQLDSSQVTKLYPDTYYVRILSLNSSFAIIER